MNRRPRRNRKNTQIRNLVRETTIGPEHLIQPFFIADGKHIKAEIPSLPGSFVWSVDLLNQEIEKCKTLGLDKFILFPKIPEKLKDKTGSYGVSPDNFYLHCCRRIKERHPNITLISDVALDPYSSDGHDGIVREGDIVNDESLEILGQMAVLQADAGFDILGPSDMMDGRVGFIRQALDAKGFTNTSIMSYTAKYASAFYGPFRDALDSAPVVSDDIPGDKKSYQMDPGNVREALIEAKLDASEGADYLMVKPAIHYLDVISAVRNNFDLPVIAYHVSGECAMLAAACNNGWLEWEKALPETLLSIRRAGASGIITYFAKAFAEMD